MVLILAVGTLAVPRYLQHECNFHIETVSHGGHPHDADDSPKELVFVHNGSTHVEAECTSCDLDLILVLEDTPRFDFEQTPAYQDFHSRNYSRPASCDLQLNGSRGPPSRIFTT